LAGGEIRRARTRFCVWVRQTVSSIAPRDAESANEPDPYDHFSSWKIGWSYCCVAEQTELSAIAEIASQGTDR
jgi:hypothetical protein